MGILPISAARIRLPCQYTVDESGEWIMGDAYGLGSGYTAALVLELLN